jgi:tryptophanyl-tRNA synthetase
MKRVFSGIQPSGDIHLGNYLGAIRNWVAIQGSLDCIYCIVDYHAITVEYDRLAMAGRMLELASGLLACGLNPEKSSIFVQSAVPAHTELAWIFNCVTPMGELSRQTQFKSKSEQHLDNINAGLFTYPVLQAADILLYKASRVPVGQDQEQHLELSREIARRFNARFGEVFPEPRTLFTSTPKILGLDGQSKMSKSVNNTINVDEDPETARKKLAGAFTDPNRKRRTDPGNPEICNIFTLHGFFTVEETRREIDGGCRSAGLGCVDCKKLLHEQMTAHFAPIRQRWASYRETPDQVQDILAEGAKRCRRIAGETMAEVRDKLGFLRDQPR